MPLTNGDATGSTAALFPHQETLDFRKALEVLEAEYPSRDGLDIKQLIDSQKHGGLTYNDFLVLPGYIGGLPQPNISTSALTFLVQASLLLP